MITDGSFAVRRPGLSQTLLLVLAAGAALFIGPPSACAMQLPSHLPPPTDPNTASSSPDSGNGSGSNSGNAGSGESSSVAPPSDSDSAPSTSGDADRNSSPKASDSNSRAHNPEPPPGATPPPDADDDDGDNAAGNAPPHGAGKSTPAAKSAPPVGPGESSSAAPDATRDPEDEPAAAPPSRGGKSPSKSAGHPPADSAGKDAPDYAPLHAEESMEIGTFYMRKGDLSAAADRFKYAIELQPHLAKPHLLLAKIAEKKNDKAAAVRYYQEYLGILPNAPDAAKVRARIADLKR